MAEKVGLEVRLIQASDNEAVARIIRTVMPEFGASGPGFAIHDQEVEDMFSSYTVPRSAYFVCVLNSKVVGGGGVAQLAGGNINYCELKKMYFLPEGRGRGLGQAVLTACLERARAFAYQYCYLETFRTMTRAMQFYERNGFIRIPGPLGRTGHFGCDSFYQLSL